MENDKQTTFTVDKNNPIIEGRDNLKNCYFFHEGKMVYAGDNVRGLRGFSVWFKPYNNSTSVAATSKFILDGIDYTTDVERIMATEDSSIDSKFACHQHILQENHVYFRFNILSFHHNHPFLSSIS